MSPGRNSLVALIFLLIGLSLQKGYFDEFPSHVHAWAQADHLALARGYLRNGYDFFKPETYVLNHQFPDDWQVPGHESITSVDFPLHQYIPSLFMGVLGYSGPGVFRIYVFIWSLAGLFFLYLLAFQITKNFFKSLFVALFAATSPLFVYYQTGILPTIPSLSGAVIGINFYLQYKDSNRDRHFALAIVFLTLAALSRTTLVIFLCAVLATEFTFYLIYKRTISKKNRAAALLGLCTIGAYYIYNGYLKNTYGTLFLPHLMTPSDPEEVFHLLKVISERWALTYFSSAQYAVAGVFLLVYLLRRRFFSGQHYIWVLTAFLFAGFALFSLVMMRQFADHDYYFLDTFFLPVLILLCLILGGIPWKSEGNMRWVVISGLILVTSIFWLSADSEQKSRREAKPWDRISQTVENYWGSAQFLDSLGVSRDARILAIDAVAPNIPFLLMERKGYAVMAVDSLRVANSLDWDFDVVTIQNSFFLSHLYRAYPEILNRIEKIATNDGITVAQKREIGRSDLKDFIGLARIEPVVVDSCGFEVAGCPNWRQVDPDSEEAFSGDHSHHLDPSQEFGPALKIKSVDLTEFRSGKAFIQFMCSSKGPIRDCDLVLTIGDGSEQLFYQGINFREFIRSKNEWYKVELLYDFGDVDAPSAEMAVYIWNRGGAEILVDDFRIEIY